MKELSIKEKAARYDRAIERAKYYYNEGKTLEYANDIASNIFPELKKSEDERIIHWIRKELEAKYVVDNIVNNVIADKALAWLEKQGKQKPTDEEMKILLQTEYEKGKADAIKAAMEAVIKDKESAIKFLKSTDIMNDNGELAKEYVVDDIEQNTAWSEEDEKILNMIISDYIAASKSFCGYQGKLDWLKLIKERVQSQPKQEWKPSEEQMKSLSLATQCVYAEEDIKNLESLYTDLKKI